MSLDQKRNWIIDQFNEVMSMEGFERIERIGMTSDLYAKLCFMSDHQLDAIEAVVNNDQLWPEYWSSVGHDIQGMAAKSPHFVPRLVEV